MTDEDILTHRFRELAEAAYSRGRTTFTDFLGLMELSLFYRAQPSFSYVPVTLFGGAEGCERVMARFGDEGSLGYSPDPFPIACLSLSPAAPKFAEPLSHRDCLGALMNLGVRRECLGDIAFCEGGAFLFCEEKLVDYLCESLTRVRHTDVRVTRATPPATVLTRTRELTVQLASLRLDGMLAHVFRLSRADAAALIASHRVFVNGRQCESASLTLREGDLCTARGYGRFRFAGVAGQTRKGNLNVLIELFS